MSFDKYLSVINSGASPAIHFFAAANSHNGFYSLFDEIFNVKNTGLVYILKGGPGVGKSTCMKSISKKASSLGYTPIEYHCSSDPFSLDGVVIKEKNVAVIDGTSPHAKEPFAAGVTEIIYDLGTCWDTCGLYLKKDILLPLIREKNANYKACYRLLSAQNSVRQNMEELSLKAFLDEKCHDFINRLCSKLKQPNQNTQSNDSVITSALSGKGKIRFFTFENLASNNYFLKDDFGLLQYFLSIVKQTAIKNSLRFTESRDVLCPEYPDGLYFPDSDTSLTLYDDEFCLSLERKGKPYKIINLKRFINNDIFIRTRESFKFYKKYSLVLEKAAIEKLACAGMLHEKLEKVYAGYTDYDKVTTHTLKLISYIFDCND